MDTPIQKNDLVIGTRYYFKFGTGQYGENVSGEFQGLNNYGSPTFINNRRVDNKEPLRLPQATALGPFYLDTLTAEASSPGIPIAKSFYAESKYYPGTTTDAIPIPTAFGVPLDNNYEEEDNDSQVILPESNSWSPVIRDNHFGGKHRKTKKTKGIKKRKRPKTKRTKTRLTRTKKNKRRIRK